MVSVRSTITILSCLGLACIGALPAVAASDITITATGTFASPPISGTDTLRLAGEPFTISVVANAAGAPLKHGRNWALYSPLRMSGTVYSGLVGPTPVSIASDAASIEQLVGPSFDEFVLGVPVKVVGIDLTVNATIILPAGTLPNQLLHLFGPVAMTPSSTTVIYSDGTSSTTLAIESGTLDATATGSTKETGVVLDRK